MQPPVAVEQRAVLGEDPDPLGLQRPQRERALAATGREQQRDRAARPGESERVQTRQPLRLQMLTEAREQVQIRRLVHEMLVLALDGEARAVVVEHRHRLAEVVDDGDAVALVDDVARRDEARHQRTEAVELRCASLDLDGQMGQVRRVVTLLEPREVEPQVLDRLGPVAGHLHAQAVNVDPGHAERYTSRPGAAPDRLRSRPSDCSYAPDGGTIGPAAPGAGTSDRGRHAERFGAYRRAGGVGARGRGRSDRQVAGVPPRRRAGAGAVRGRRREPRTTCSGSRCRR